MSEAFRAPRQLHATGQHELVREVIARRIVIATRLGVRDPVRLQPRLLRDPIRGKGAAFVIERCPISCPADQSYRH